ncbi:sensor histidine kinase [Cardiobacterium hominis]|jgi:sensor histidine kinase|uniref:histidine kinase n=1 Tax=Cardiobacterium hominis (strain ATCC 15826 / DSM 8339 / NCTC 10426 / 6573) TaxID=638300 RepID=C8N6J1_CARH6|nr:ATP-binding protein [Cardiobacterium hominis]EEV89749.1 ATPase/histidine kinase/DNA gyrase B/HSP90 domain protein [Cardiobacterium hominis ATCC 15826]VEG76750.1 Sensor kinase CusS [Cardiobacterium hominis]
MTQTAITKRLRDWGKAVRTTAFKFSLLFTLASSFVTGISMYTLYRSAEKEIREQIDSRLLAETTSLRRRFEERTSIGLYTPVLGIIERVPGDPNITFCVTAKSPPSGSNGLPFTNRNNNAPATIDTSAADLIILDSSVADLCRINPATDPGSDMRINLVMRVVIVNTADNRYTLITAYDTTNERKMLKRMLDNSIYVTGLLLIASFIGSFLIGYTIIHSISRISRTARRIVDGDFSERVPTHANDADEMSQLADDLNHMLDRIEALITSQRQVTNNIAHDLRSPLNRMRNRMEVALLDRNSEAAALREVIADSVEDAENLLKTFNALLNIAQVESRAKDDFKHESLSAICDDLAELYDVMTEEGEHSFEAHIERGLDIMGNRQLIAQAITNLLDNAVKYTPSGGHITLTAEQRGENIHVSVGDNGHGIPPDKRDDVLKRFVRLDSARSTPGNGLGLSLVSAIVALHNGSLQLHDNKPGLRIEITLPSETAYLRRQNESEF